MPSRVRRPGTVYISCKRRAPFPLAAEDWIDKNGNWGPKRSYGYFNIWNPTILQCLRANHDIKLITNGIETKDIAWYITHYVAKKHNSSSNTISAFSRKRLPSIRCGNALSREQELSAPEVISYLMGWGDRFISHRFETIHWHSVVQLLKRTYPILNAQRRHLSQSMHADPGTPDALPDSGQNDDTVNIQMVEGHLHVKDQIREYVDRGEALLTWNFLNYFLGTGNGNVSTRVSQF
ncbi:hypothetical protein EDB83DRAFT_2522880 [Lactarius deliciosus]|nr:hypothetical protein EDB83DRAFT_2522880 [Lactarius deliciosus]